MIDNRVMGDPHQPSPKFLVIDLLPVLPELDEHFLGNVLGIFLNPQAIVGKGKNPMPVLIDGLLIKCSHLLVKTLGVEKSYSNVFRACPKAFSLVKSTA